MHFNTVKLELQHVQLKICVLHLYIRYNNPYSMENGGSLFRIHSIEYVI